MAPRTRADAFLPLTPPMLHTLVALADGDKHGYAILKEIARRTDGTVRLSAGTLYALIRRAEADGLINPDNPDVLSGSKTTTPHPGATMTTTWNFKRTRQ